MATDLSRYVQCGEYSPTAEDLKRFWAKVDKSEECWVWTGAKGNKGYGIVRFRGTTRGAHRLALIWETGIPEPGLEVDHLYRNPPCVRTDHLEWVTVSENQHRSPISNATKTHCPAGHEYVPENTSYNGRGSRCCKRCDADRKNLKRWRRKMSADLSRYVRCRDLEGELWTIPSGSRLHLQLLGDLEQGNPEPFLPVDVIRRPDRGLVPFELDGLVTDYLADPDPETGHALWRIGQYLRMKERIERRCR